MQYRPDTHPKASRSPGCDTSPDTHPRASRIPACDTNPDTHPRASRIPACDTSPDTHHRSSCIPGCPMSPDTHPRASGIPACDISPNTHPRASCIAVCDTSPDTHPRGSCIAACDNSPDTHPRLSRITVCDTSPDTHPRASCISGCATSPNTHPRGSRIPGCDTSRDTHPRARRIPACDTSPDIHPRARCIPGCHMSPDHSPRGSRIPGCDTSPDAHPRASRIPGPVSLGRDTSHPRASCRSPRPPRRLHPGAATSGRGQRCAEAGAPVVARGRLGTGLRGGAGPWGSLIARGRERLQGDPDGSAAGGPGKGSGFLPPRPGPARAPGRSCRAEVPVSGRTARGRGSAPPGGQGRGRWGRGSFGSPVEPPFRRGKGGTRGIPVSGLRSCGLTPPVRLPTPAAPPGGVTGAGRMEEEPQGLGPGGCSQAPPAIIGAEDEDFENDLKQTPDDQSSLFGSLELLRTHPAYLMAFLLHAVLQFDPSPVLCFLHAELLRSLGAKEAKKQFVDFYHSFIDKAGLLRVPIPEKVQFELDRTRPELLPDDIQRQFLAEIQFAQEPEISRQLEGFRSNRQMGMTPGAVELGELESYQTRDKGIREAKEKQLAETLLARLEDMQSTISADEERSLAIFTSIAAYMKHLGVKTRTGDSKKSKGNFFRKKISGNRKLEEPPRRRGFGILDAARWARDTPNPDPRPSKGPQGEAEKAAVPDRKGQKVPEGGAQRSRGAAVGAPGPDPPSLAVTISTPQAEGPEGDAGSEAPKTTDMLDVSPKGGSLVEPPPSDTQPPEEAVECERLPGRLGRSESLRAVERRRSQRGSAKGKPPRSRSDVDLDAAARAGALAAPPGPPSRCVLEPGEPPPFLSAQPEEAAEPRPAPSPELPELEPPGTWRQLVAPDALLRLQPTEVKRQEVINELFMTEFAHVRMLRVLLEVFYQPLLADSFLAEDELVAMFPGLEDLLEVHGLFLESLRKLRDDNNYVVPEIGDVLLARFEGPEGGWFEKISARFCSCQSRTLKQLKAKQRRDPRFAQFIQEAESQARCRRLQLKDIVPIEMQRLTKYPLLLQNIAKYTEAPEEQARVEHAAECCRHILHRVNQEVRDMENFMKMKDYQGRLDLSYLKQSSDPQLSDFKASDITKRHLVHEGLLTWRVSKDKAVEVQALLLDDLLVLLQRQEERLVLRCQSRPVSAPDTAKLSLSPIVRLSSAITRQVATDRKAFYVISSCEKAPQIYELVAQTVSEMKSWCSLIDTTAGSIKLPESSSVKHSRPGQNPPSPSYCREPLLSTSENGASLKETEERDKDRALEGAEFEERSPVPPPHNDTPALAALLALARPLGGAEGGLAAAALQRVSALRRLLLGEDQVAPSTLPPHARAEAEAPGERDPGDGAEGSEAAPGGSLNGPQPLALGGPGTPPLLPSHLAALAQDELQPLELTLHALRNLEEEFWLLQGALAKCGPPMPGFT